MACVSRLIVAVIAAWLLGVAPSQAGVPASLFIDAFDVEEVPSLTPGAVLQFSVFASPGASATVLIEGVRRLVELREVQPGVYEGTYVIEAGDRLHAGTTAVATVWRDGAVVRATLEESLLLDAAPPRPVATPARPAAPAPAPAPAPVPRVAPPEIAAPPQGERLVACRDCAVVESIRAVEVPTGPAYAGAIAGGIVGALFGEQIGKAHERHVTTFLGAISGAVLGHEVQRAAASRTWYDAALRLPNGALRVRRYDAPPPFRVGQLVRLDAVAGAAPSL
jgi:outer membrane lipoprotein SlyB